MAAPPRVLGDDGEFRLERNAMGVPGLHVAVNVFDPELHKRLFDDRVFTDGSHDWKHQNQVGPTLKQAILHPLNIPGVSYPWPDDWHRIANAVRDCGLFEQAVIPDNAYALTYQTDPQKSQFECHNDCSQFQCHYDGRGKWGEYVICYSLGCPCTLTFQHCAPKTKKPFDPSHDWTYEPPVPPTDAYWTRSKTEEKVEPVKRRVWQLSMTLPPNSMYVMSGPSRYDWQHGINVNLENHALPIYNPENAFLFPCWNLRDNIRRAVIFRSTKVFSDVSLEVEREAALVGNDMEAVASLQDRLAIASKFPNHAHNEENMRVLQAGEVQRYRAEAEYVLYMLQQSGAHRLRFEPNQVNYDGTRHVRAVADSMTRVPENVARAASAVVNDSTRVTNRQRDWGGGTRLGHGTNSSRRSGARATRTSNGTEVIMIDDSDDEEEVQDRTRPADVAGLNDTMTDQERAQVRAVRLARFA